MRPLLLILTLAAFLACPAHARLGESEAETIARYGPLGAAYDPGTQGFAYRTLVFNHAGFTILSMFIGQACEMVLFQKPDHAALSEEEIDLLLKSEADSQKWHRSNLVSTDLLWDRPDGAMARYDVAKHALAFCSAKYLNADSARQKAEQKRQLDNL